MDKMKKFASQIVKRYKIKKLLYAVFLLGILLLTGCRRVEPEVRAYPLALGLDYRDGLYRIYYAMPDLSAYSGDGKGGEKQDLLWLYEGDSFQNIEKQVRSSRDQLLDLGHVQTILFADTLLQSGEPYEQVLQYLEEQKELGSSAYVFSCEALDQVMEQNGKMTESLGEYLVDLIDKEEGVARRERPKILQHLYNAWYNGEEVPALLQVEYKDSYLVVKESKDKKHSTLV